MLRGRIPAMVCFPNEEIQQYIPQGEELFVDRQLALGAVLTGRADGLLPGRDRFRSFCYIIAQHERSASRRPVFLWPPFIVAQEAVIGKNLCGLRKRFERPDLDHAHAFLWFSAHHS